MATKIPTLKPASKMPAIASQLVKSNDEANNNENKVKRFIMLILVCRKCSKLLSTQYCCVNDRILK